MKTNVRPITVIGSMNMDLVTRVRAFPRPGETVAGSNLSQIPGGKGANQAVAAARAGAPVYFVGAVGADDFGQRLRRELQVEGVNVRQVRRETDAPTGVALITVNAEGENQIVISPGANAKVTGKRVEEAQSLIRRSRLVLLQREIPISAVRKALQIAAAANVPVVFNPAPAAPLTAALLRRVTVLIVNQSEATTLLGRREPPRKAVSTLAAQTGGQTAILTVGREGSWVCTPKVKKPCHLPAPRVKTVDTTAAGDTFVGAFAVRFLECQHVEAAVQFATAAAALAVTYWGAQPSIPHRREIQRFLRRRRLGS